MPRMKRTTHVDVLNLTKGMGKAERNHTVCDLVGHSRIVRLEKSFRPDLGPGEVYETVAVCARCKRITPRSDEQLVVGSVRNMANRAKFKAMNWRDKVYAPENPFTTESC